MNLKGQGALEYLLIIGGAIMVAAIVIALMMGASNPTKCSTNDNVLSGLCAKNGTETACAAAVPSSSCAAGDCKWINGICTARLTTDTPPRSTGCFPC